MELNPGTVVGRLTIVERSGTYVSPKGYKKPIWLCKCECGVEKQIISSALRNGDTISCGCKRSSGRGHASYRTMHWKLGHKKGSASAHQCAQGCGRKAAGWAYNHEDPDEVAGLNRDRLVWYSTKLDNYDPLCSWCHNNLDSETPIRPFPREAVEQRINHLENLIEELRSLEETDSP